MAMVDGCGLLAAWKAGLWGRPVSLVQRLEAACKVLYSSREMSELLQW